MEAMLNLAPEDVLPLRRLHHLDLHLPGKDDGRFITTPRRMSLRAKKDSRFPQQQYS
jgi:hypothetical protein